MSAIMGGDAVEVSFLLPFGSFLSIIDSLDGGAKLSTPFWEFPGAVNFTGSRAYDPSLSTPFWEFPHLLRIWINVYEVYTFYSLLGVS